MQTVSAFQNHVTDTKGRQWLDMLSGILNVSLGHGSPVVQAALREVDNCGFVNTYDRPARNAHLLRDLMGEYAPAFSWQLLNTGAEAIERAIQVVATIKGSAPRIAVLGDSFHGKSLSMACARYAVPWGNPLRIMKIDPTNPVSGAFDALIYEPIKGWHGVAPDPIALRTLCDAHGAFLIADEMITGFHRCGPRFMSDDFADIIVTGKGIAQGAPLALLGMHRNIEMPRALATGWTTTAGGNNLSATIGLRALEHLMLLENTFTTKAEAIAHRLCGMGFNAHGALGFMRVADNRFDAVRDVFDRAGIIMSWHRPFIRVGPSFVTTDEQLQRLKSTLEDARL